jgi:two-component system response regulator BaeR
VTAPAAEAPAATASDPIDIDPDLRSSLPAFYASRRRALESIAAALSADDRMAVKRLAHKLAGSFALYGFRWAAAECRGIQLEALTADNAALAVRVAAVRAHLDATELSHAEPTL